jgi:hypothetical protein
MADTVISEPEKVCTKCEVSKPATTKFFAPRKSRACWLRPICRACQAANARNRYADPEYHAVIIARRASDPALKAREVIRNKVRLADAAHQAKEAERHKNRLLDPDYRRRELERGRRRRADPEHRAKTSEFGKNWYVANKASRADKSKAWYEKHRGDLMEWRRGKEYREHTNKWLRSHHQKHPDRKLQRNVGVAICTVLQDGGAPGAFRHLPYTATELRSHLEKQMLQGMTWENYGSGWHVDHILAQSSFRIDVSDPANCPEFQACWALPNLRPLWKADNLSKSAKRLHLI